jgi:hypothetical protein
MCEPTTRYSRLFLETRPIPTTLMFRALLSRLRGSDRDDQDRRTHRMYNSGKAVTPQSCNRLCRNPFGLIRRSPRTVRAVVNLDGESPCNGCHFERRPTPVDVEITGQTLSKSMDTATMRQPIPPPPHRIMVASERDVRQATLTPLLGRHRLIDRHLSCLVNFSVGKPKIGAGEGSAG